MRQELTTLGCELTMSGMQGSVLSMHIYAGTVVSGDAVEDATRAEAAAGGSTGTVTIASLERGDVRSLCYEALLTDRAAAHLLPSLRRVRGSDGLDCATGEKEDDEDKEKLLQRLTSSQKIIVSGSSEGDVVLWDFSNKSVKCCSPAPALRLVSSLTSPSD
eukprot:747657-Hanusia_phi.AAC.1